MYACSEHIATVYHSFCGFAKLQKFQHEILKIACMCAIWHCKYETFHVHACISYVNFQRGYPINEFAVWLHMYNNREKNNQTSMLSVYEI